MDRNPDAPPEENQSNTSLSARRAWIEMLPPMYPRKYGIVALRKESVDRNKRLGLLGWLRTVALRKESVDRNFRGWTLNINGPMSLSARRAWIEIQIVHQWADHNGVALRKESVDRNNVVVHSTHPHKSSLSARRAWIEIYFQDKKQQRT